MTPTKQSRRQFLETAASASIAFAAAAQNVEAAQFTQATQATPPAGAPLSDVVLTNGRIHTMDAKNTVASSVTIRNGRIAAVGGNPPAGLKAVDLRGRTVVPGLIEGHVHIVSLANRPGYHTILENTTSIREIQETLAARRKSVPEGQWITSMGGWHPNQWAEHRHPTLKELDEAVPDRPVLLYERFTGPAVTNTAGKKILDAIDAAAPAHPEVKKVAVADNGVIAARRTVGERAVSSTALADVRRQETQHRRRDDVLGGPRPDGASRRSAFPHSGAVASKSNPLEPRSVPDVRLVDRPASRRAGARPDADEFPAEPERPRAAGIERASPQSIPVLRR
jgi:hypothetical protein